MTCQLRLVRAKLSVGIPTQESILTAVMVSMHRTKGSDVRYLESDIAYSFQNWPKRSLAGAMRVWLTEK